MAIRLLVVEDEVSIRQMLGFALEDEGFEMLEASSSEQALSDIKRLIDNTKKLPDLILLDWMLPGASGIEFTRRLKKNELTREIPIILLTARGEEDDRVRGLDSGADDYVVKPFSPRELIARINAILRRKDKISSETMTVGKMKMDLKSHRITVAGKAISLGPTEFKILRYFMENQDRVFSRSQLLDAVWGSQVVLEERTVDVHIRRLRKALAEENAENLIHTVRGAGYKMSES